MSFLKHNSWGRTRSPKNLAGPHGTEITVLNVTTTLVGVGSGSSGYATENQRYLHVLVEDDTGDATNPAALYLYGYCHAFQRWWELGQQDPAAANQSPGSNTATTAAEIDVAGAGSNADPAAQVPSDREYRRYEIAGVDRVAFVHATPAHVNVFAACSTF